MTIQVNKGVPTEEQINSIHKDARIVMWYPEGDFHQNWSGKNTLKASLKLHEKYYKDNVMAWYTLPTKEEFEREFGGNIDEEG